MDTFIDSFSHEDQIRLLIAILSFIPAIFGKVFNWGNIIPHRKLKEESRLEFISSFLAFDISKRHPLLVEQAMKIYFEFQIDYEVIRLLMRLNNPTNAFLNYKKAKSVICIDENGRLNFQDRLSTHFKRKFWKCIFITLYFVLMYFAVFITFFMWGKNLLSLSMGGVVFLWNLMLIYFAMLCLFEIEKQNAANQLIDAHLKLTLTP